MRHLAERDGWIFSGVDARCVHLMVQCMEAWIVADVDALASYYGQGFVRNALPQRPNLEEEPKADLCGKLDRATENTKTKKKYNKIAHAGELLGRIDPERITERCPHFRVLESWLEETISSL